MVFVIGYVYLTNPFWSHVFPFSKFVGVSEDCFVALPSLVRLIVRFHAQLRLVACTQFALSAHVGLSG